MNRYSQETTIELVEHGKQRRDKKRKHLKIKSDDNQILSTSKVEPSFEALAQTNTQVTAYVKNSPKNRTTLGTFSSKVGKNMGSTLKGLDIYGQPVNLNYKGEDTFKTTPGGCLSIVYFLWLLAYFFMKLKYMLSKVDWKITQQVIVAGTEDFEQVYNFSDYSNITLALQI